MVIYLPISRLLIIFKLFALNISHIHSKNMCNNIEINWHLATLFVLEYIHLLDSIDNYFISSHIKTKQM